MLTGQRYVIGLDENGKSSLLMTGLSNVQEQEDFFLWTNNCPRPSALERWGAMPAADWDHYLGAAERYLDVHDDTFATSVRQQRNSRTTRLTAGRGRPRHS